MGLDNDVDELIEKGDKRPRKEIEREIIERDAKLAREAGDEEEGGRLERRLRKNNNNTNDGGRLSSGSDGLLVDRMHGFSRDDETNAMARRAWMQIRQKGWLIDPSGISGEQIETQKKQSTSIGMSNIGARIANRKRSIKIGDISKNNSNSANQETWMLPVEKLKRMMTIPVEWDEETGDVAQRRQINNEELAMMLNLSVSESKKLDSPNAGLSFNDFMYLVAEIGNEPRFDSWRLFSPTTPDEIGISESNYSQKAVENLGRAKLRERFALETFGKDAFPMYLSRDGKTRISQEEYGKLDDEERFGYGGIFKDDGSADDANTELMYEGLRTNSPIPFTQNTNQSNSTALGNTKTTRSEFRLSELLEALGISETEIAERDKKLNEILKNSGIGEQARKNIGRWESQGIPTSAIAEMIKSGIIKDAKSVFKNTDSGERLDKELSRPKYVVYESLLGFIKQTQGNSPLNTRKTVYDILGSTDAYNYLPQIAKTKGSIPYSANVGDAPRYSDYELQQIVNRFNDIFGTQHTIDDIFSDEQIRQAKERIEKDGTHSPIGKPNVRTKLKNENNE